MNPFVVSCVLLLLSNTSYVLLIEASQTEKQGFGYSFLVFLLLTSILKALLSGLAIAVQNRQVSRSQTGDAPIHLWGQVSLRLVLLSAGSAALYAVNDILVFKVMSYFPSASYSVLVTGKIAVVALLSRVLLRKVLTRLQVVACVLLTVGIINFQYDFCNSAEDGGKGNQVAMEGYLVVLVAEIVGGLAGIINEYFLDQSAHLPVHCHNLLMYTASIVLYTASVLTAEWPRFSKGQLFGGWSGLVTVMVFVNSIRGISVSLIFKSSTNMTKVFIVIPGIILTWLWSSVFYGFEITLQAVLAIIIIMSALWMYATEQQLQAVENTTGSAGSSCTLPDKAPLAQGSRRSSEEMVHLTWRGAEDSAGHRPQQDGSMESVSPLAEEEVQELREWESLRSVLVRAPAASIHP